MTATVPAATAAPVGPGHRSGLLRMVVRTDPAGTTGVRELHQRFPLRTTVPFHLDPHDLGMAFVYVQNPTGGIFEGDRLHTDIEVGPGARLHVTTQSATKVYAMDHDHAVSSAGYRVRAGGYLENIPDMIIPQAGARLRQPITVDLDDGATYVGSEIVAPGRVARDESFGYHSLHLDTTVRSAGTELCIDALRLDPHAGTPARPGVMGDACYLVSLLVAAPGRDVETMAQRLDGVAATAGGPDGAGAAGALPNAAGVSLRVLTRDARSARAALLECWGEARLLLLDRPLPRIRK